MANIENDALTIWKSICKHSDDMKRADEVEKEKIRKGMAIKSAKLAKELSDRSSK